MTHMRSIDSFSLAVSSHSSRIIISPHSQRWPNVRKNDDTPNIFHSKKLPPLRPLHLHYSSRGHLHQVNIGNLWFFHVFLTKTFPAPHKNPRSIARWPSKSKAPLVQLYFSQLSHEEHSEPRSARGGRSCRYRLWTAELLKNTEIPLK